MADRDLNQVWEEFVGRKREENPTRVQEQFERYSNECWSDGLQVRVTLSPIFLSPQKVEHQNKIGRFSYKTGEKTLSAVMDPTHKHSKTLCDYLQITPGSLLDEVRLKAKPIMPVVMRPDTADTDPIPFTHETNTSWPGGISDTDITLDRLFKNDLFREFVTEMEQKGILIEKPRPNAEYLLDELVRQANIPAGDRPSIVIALPQTDVRGFSGDEINLTRRIRDSIQKRGYDVALISPNQIEYNSKDPASVPRHDGRVIDIVYRIFEWGHVMKFEDDVLGYRKVVQAYNDGKLVVVNSFASDLIGAKSIHLILLDEKLEDLFDPAEIKEHRKYIPPTEKLSEVSAEKLSHIMREPFDFVLKPIRGSSGGGVHVGKNVICLKEWQEYVEAGRKDGNVLVQDDTGTALHRFMFQVGSRPYSSIRKYDLDPFVIGGEPTGSWFCRFSPSHMTSDLSLGGIAPVVAWRYEKQ